MMRKKGFVDNAVGMRHRNLQDRFLAFQHYGGNKPECACCGQSTFSFLTIDHIVGGGSAERIELFGSKYTCGHHMYRELRKRGFPPGYQVLCMNCQVGRRDNGGQCPHKSYAPQADELLKLFDALRVGKGNWEMTRTESYKKAWMAVQRKKTENAETTI
jgi:hypothetical protein